MDIRQEPLVLNFTNIDNIFNIGTTAFKQQMATYDNALIIKDTFISADLFRSISEPQYKILFSGCVFDYDVCEHIMANAWDVEDWEFHRCSVARVTSNMKRSFSYLTIKKPETGEECIMVFGTGWKKGDTLVGYPVTRIHVPDTKFELENIAVESIMENLGTDDVEVIAERYMNYFGRHLPERFIIEEDDETGEIFSPYYDMHRPDPDELEYYDDDIDPNILGSAGQSLYMNNVSPSHLDSLDALKNNQTDCVTYRRLNDEYPDSFDVTYFPKPGDKAEYHYYGYLYGDNTLYADKVVLKDDCSDEVFPV